MLREFRFLPQLAHDFFFFLSLIQDKILLLPFPFMSFFYFPMHRQDILYAHLTKTVISGLVDK